MKVYFDKLKKNEPLGVIWKDRNICFVATRPVIIQPSEIIKVPLNLALKIEENCIIVISTHPNLYSKAAAIFPASLILDESVKDNPVELAVRNSGRDPLNLMVGDLLAIGYLQPTVDLEPEAFSVSYEVPKSRTKSKPSKKNTDIGFEIK